MEPSTAPDSEAIPLATRDPPAPEEPLPLVSDQIDDTTPQLKDGESSTQIVVHKDVVSDDDTPKIGQTFRTQTEACHFYKQYAHRSCFGAQVRSSNFTKSGACEHLVLACSKYRAPRGKPLCDNKTNCPAFIRLRLLDDGLLHVVKAKLEHNHPLNPKLKDAKMSNFKLRRPVLVPHDFVHDEKGLLCIRKDGESSTEIGCMKLGEGNNEDLNQFFTRMQTKNANFFYLMDIDETGRLRNVFWADPISRAAYQHFGDVISVKTICSINKGTASLVVFLGVNHHCQPVLLGCGLLSDETTETYMWLFKAWLACMLGRAPKAIITDQCGSIRDAFGMVFPDARHRFCLWNLMRKMPEKVRAFAERDAIKKAMEKVVYGSLRGDEFEKGWTDMVEKFELQHSEWFSMLYEERHSWVPVFLKDTFWAGMCDNQCCKRLARFFDGFVNSETLLSEFVAKYEAALQTKYEKEAQADHESLHKPCRSVSKFYMEEQLSKLYTYNVFWKFQDELKATMYCDVSLVKVDEPRSTFDVKESVFMEDGLTEIKEYQVLYDANEAQVQCICGYFQFQGVLCRHALAVLKFQQVYEVPSQYIINRWRKDYKQLYTSVSTDDDFLPNNPMERHGYLSMRCLQLVDFGSKSVEKCKLTLELIREVEKLLIDDSTNGDGKQNSMNYKSRLTEISKNHVISQLGTPDGAKNVDLHVKRRGRPPKKRKELETEIPNVSNNAMQETSERSFVENQGVAALLVGHTTTRRSIDLMKDANPNDLTSDKQFESHGNNLHGVGNELGVQLDSRGQGQFDQQTIGWFYQRTSQGDKLPDAVTGRMDAY